jgi:alpha-1,3-rhamnosyl/mannosyltransferase
MRVVVNQLVTLGRKTGIGHYTGELLRFLRPLAGADPIDTFPAGWLRRACKAVTRARPYLGEGRAQSSSTKPASRQVGLRGRTLNLLRQGSWSVLGGSFRAFCARGRYDLYHEPNVIPFPVDCPTIATLHDLSVLLYPEWHPADRVAYYEHHFRASLGHCVHFLAVSEFTRQEVIRLLNIPAERVTRTYNGIRPGLVPKPRAEVEPVLRQLDLPSQYLLYLGTIEPRKNVLMLLRAYCSLPDELRSRWPLLLVGNWGWNAGAVADYLHQEARHRGVIHRGYLKERHLAAIYNGARALVYPSWYEGFGLPPLEMMACGGAVLASTAGAVAETVGDRAHLIDPADGDGWRAAMQRVLEDDDWWQALRRDVEAVGRLYTWDRCAAETLRVYRSCCGLTEDQAMSVEPHPFSRRRTAG